MAGGMKRVLTGWEGASRGRGEPGESPKGQGGSPGGKKDIPRDRRYKRRIPKGQEEP